MGRHDGIASWLRQARGGMPVVLALCGGWLAAAGAGAQPPAVAWSLPGDELRIEAPEGHAWVRWSTQPAQATEAFLIERRAPGEAPASRRIADTATFIAGLPAGTTELRVRAESGGVAGPWSPTLSIEVSYPSLTVVRFLGSLGTALLVATIALVVAGHRRFAGRGKAPAARDAEPGRG